MVLIRKTYGVIVVVHPEVGNAGSLNCKAAKGLRKLSGALEIETDLHRVGQ